MQRLLRRPRLEKEILTCLKESPATVILGARQTGKTTLAHLTAGRFRQVTIFDLERAAARRALATPEMALGDLKGLVVLDEVQRMPELFETLRPLCDRAGRPARFLMLGSASANLVSGVSESLAGRVLFVRVPGFSIDEIGEENQNRLWMRGGFPRAYLAKGAGAWHRWLDGFVTTFLERDIPQMGIRVPAMALRRFWTMLAHYHGQVWNASESARSMDVAPATTKHYLDILSGAFTVRVLPPWHENVGKRQVKSPKVYLRDSGLLHFLLGIESMEQLRAHPRYGASWEGFALEQTLALLGDRDAYFWATQRGAELDLMVIRGGQRHGFEFKCTDAPSMTRSMHVALADLHLKALYAVYPGKDRYRLHKRAEAIPLAVLGSLRMPGSG
jgi:predicted AAA+ superfamily ATPase